MSKKKQDRQCIFKRRSMLKYGISIGMLPLTGAAYSKSASAKSTATPTQTEGPFYPVHQQVDKDADLTRIQGSSRRARGTIINVVGRVLTPNGKPLQNATVEIWQANANGRYQHFRDPNPAEQDPDFQGWGITKSDEQGFYRFLTIIPGAYPAGPGWMRPPHIHFKIAIQNYQTLTTQMYFPGNNYNASDLILQSLSDDEQQLVISKQVDELDGVNSYKFDIVLRPGA